jgi:prepilin-type N-terminal cleavage/methylation domain-containing protein
MFNTISNKRGMSLVEMAVALLLIGVGVLSLVSLQPSAWRLSGKSDYLGRASGVLAAQLQATEASIMNPNIAVATGTTSSTVYAGGQGTAKQGDVQITVNRTITALGGNLWRVTVKVTWPGNAAGITESLNVSRQEYFRQ